ncbi:SusC/RagA family TonB-linked outer membrane protein [Chitinophaga sp. RCC_12]|uniref:SusC/RagA family TonB-linked outer membrane protein n=1 Tax=Chitinophaga sp. RCC_12 TaxID=3239226 RepID=UPI00352423BE
MRNTSKLSILMFSFLVLLQFKAAYAQSRRITGVVRGTDNQPIPGVTVFLKGQQQNANTDETGHYAIQVGNAGKQELEFRLVGYLPKTVQIGTQSTIDVSLSADVKGLGEVVVVGYGTQKKATMAGAVGVIKAEAISNRPITSATQALSGQVPGVWVNQSSGQPGNDDATIRVRGIGTIGNSNALVIVDGIVGSLRSVNPNDIESISVLKDASAAIYGSRAANGVILVQTKSGKKGKVVVDFSTSYGKQRATALPEVTTNSVDYMQLYNQALINQGSPAFYSQATIDEYKNGKDPIVYPNTDWRKVVLHDAAIQTNQLSVAGGQDKTQFNMSLGYTNQDGIVKNGNAKLYNLRANITSKINNKLEVGLRSGFRYETSRQSFNGAGNLFTELNRTLPFYGTYTADGEYAGTWVNSINTQFRNPLAMINEGKNDAAINVFNGNAFLNYEIIDGLKFNLTGGIDYRNADNEIFTPKTDIYNPKTNQVASTMNAGGAKAQNSWEKNLYATVFTSLTYHKVIADDHDFTLAGIYSQEKNDYRSLSGSIMGFVNNSLTEINAGLETPLVNGTSNGWALRSYIGRFNYAYKEKYMLEAIARYDGSSRFAPDSRWGFFPSILAAWRISKESFMESQQVFNELKIRGSWGRSGNDQIGLYAYLPTLAFARFYPFNDLIMTGIAQMSIVDQNIQWEVGTKKNIGFDASMLKGRINVNFDYFQDDRDGILRTIQLPGFIGIRNAPTKNLASVSNKGWELSAGYNQEFGQVKFSAGINVTHIRNEVVSIPDPQLSLNALIAGQPINAYYMWKALGIFQSQEEVDNSPKQNAVPTKPGDIKFEDISGPAGKPDGVIDANDRQVTGKPIPTWTYGGYLTAAWKGFDARINVQGVSDVDAYVGSELYFPFLNGAGVLKRWEPGNTWTPETPNAKLPRLLQYSASSSQNYANNSFWLQDASFLRIKDIQIGFTLPERWLSRVKIQGLRVYVDAQNAFTFTRFEGLDPEKDFSTTSSAQYPNVRILSAGLNLKF